MVVFCPDCNGVAEEETSRGHLVCTECGNVLEESVLKAEVTFTERAAGNATADGCLVGADQARAKSRVKFGTVRQGGIESREQTIFNGKRRIQQLASTMRMAERHVEVAVRTFTLAVNHNFTKGRRSQVVVAACLYMVCRLEKLPHMLIDFAEMIQTNVYALGATFLQLARKLEVILPNIDPTIYILRFAHRLDFGDKTTAVAEDASRLVSRMNYDWMTLGRRPSGVCAACLFIAARMHGFRRTHREIVSIVKICETTLRKRLGEFKETESGSMSIKDFQQMAAQAVASGGKWQGRQFDPPSLLQRGKKKRAQELTPCSVEPEADSIDDESNAEDQDAAGQQGGVEEEADDAPFSPARSRLRKRSSSSRRISENDDIDDEDLNMAEPLAEGAGGEEMEESDIMEEMNKTLQNPEFQQQYAEMGAREDLPTENEGEVLGDPSRNTSTMSDNDSNGVDPITSTLIQSKLSANESLPSAPQPVTTILPSSFGIVIKDHGINGESALLGAPDGESTAETANGASLTEAEEDWAALDDDVEIANVLLSEPEIELKTKLWEEENRDWEEKQARKRILEQASGKDSDAKKPRRNRKDKDASKSQPAATAAEAARNLLATKKQLSKKINHEMLDKLFDIP
ncbi:hypothetical protein SeLEV6574_g00125 [Synchytrium endobioticum]|uniref:B-related factor 1 n=1 Tax=Synchytrium endobioticum TaxID=286115 RepID=A0A507DKM2_9FUNG|nr:hypothetical protein SeLEV6574_g00125 [Synchytrium endobioticum]